MAERQALRLGKEAGLVETPDRIYWGYRQGEEGVAEEPMGDAEAYLGSLGALAEAGGG